MKNLNRKKMKKTIIYLLVAVWGLMFSVSCTEDFEEMNKDPFNPTTTTIEPVFNSITKSLLLGWQEQAGLHNTFYYYYSQQGGRFGISGYLLDASINDIWKNYYQTMADYRLMEGLFETYEGEKDLTNVQAMVKIMMAYKTLKMIETFGDIPYSEAGKGKGGADYFRVVFDDDREIYKSCLADLKWASDNLTTHDESKFTIGSFDVLFNGEIIPWKKWANSLILRHSLRIYDVEQQLAGDLLGAVLGNASAYPLIEEGEDMCFWPRDLGIDFEGRGWSFWSENMLRLGTAMWDVMSENDEVDGSGIFDPRCHVFFEPNDDDEWVAFPQNPSASTPPEIVGRAYKKGRDDDWEDKGGIQYSPFNYYLVRDQWDVPELIQTAAEVKLLKAEAYAKGAGVGTNLSMAQQEYEAAMRMSVAFWYKVVSITDLWTTHVPAEPTEAEVDAFVAHPVVAWDDNKALELIYTQRWVETFRQPWEGFHLWNYTHMTPRDTDGAYNASDYDFYRIHYPIDEQKYNMDNWSAATNNGAQDLESVKLFWHK